MAFVAGRAAEGGVPATAVGVAELSEFLSADPKLRMSGPTLPTLIEEALAESGLGGEVGAGGGPRLECGAFAGFMEALQQRTLRAMLPHSVSALPDRIRHSTVRAAATATTRT